MKREDIRRFAGRDWSRLAAAKDRAWLRAKQAMSADDAIRSADELRKFALDARAGWPDRVHRADDLQTHVRVSEALGAVHVRPR